MEELPNPLEYRCTQWRTKLEFRLTVRLYSALSITARRPWAASLQNRAGGIGVFVDMRWSTGSVMIVSGDSFFGVSQSGRAAGTNHAVSIGGSDSYALTFSVSDAVSVIGARDCGLLGVIVSLSLVDHGNSTLLLNTDRAQSTNITFSGGSLFGISGSRSSSANCGTSATISGNGLAGTTESSTSATTSVVAAVEINARSSINVSVMVVANSTVGVVTTGMTSATMIDFGTQRGGALAIIFDGSNSSTVQFLDASLVGVVSTSIGATSAQLQPMRSFKSPVVIFSAMRSVRLCAVVASHAFVGVSDVAVSSETSIVQWNMFVCHDSRVQIGSHVDDSAMIGVRLTAALSCVPNSTTPNVVTKRNNITSAFEVVLLSVPNSTNLSVAVIGVFSLLGVRSEDCEAFSASGSAVILNTELFFEARRLLKVDATFASLLSLRVASGGTVGVTLGLSGQQEIRISEEMITINASFFLQFAVISYSGRDSLIGLRNTTFADSIRDFQRTFVDIVMVVYSIVLSLEAAAGATIGADTIKLSNVTGFCVTLDVSQAKMITLTSVVTSSVMGVRGAMSNISLTSTVGTNIVLLQAVATEDLSVTVRDGAALGLVQVFARAYFYVHLKLADLIRATLLIANGSGVGALNTTMQSYGTTAMYCIRCVGFTLMVVSYSTLGIANSSSLIATTPQISLNAVLLDLSFTNNSSTFPSLNPRASDCATKSV